MIYDISKIHSYVYFPNCELNLNTKSNSYVSFAFFLWYFKQFLFLQNVYFFSFKKFINFFNYSKMHPPSLSLIVVVHRSIISTWNVEEETKLKLKFNWKMATSRKLKTEQKKSKKKRGGKLRINKQSYFPSLNLCIWMNEWMSDWRTDWMNEWMIARMNEWNQKAIEEGESETGLLKGGGRWREGVGDQWMKSATVCVRNWS